MFTGDDDIDNDYWDKINEIADELNARFPNREKIVPEAVRSVFQAQQDAAYNASQGESTYLFGHGSLDINKAGTIYTADGGDK